MTYIVRILCFWILLALSQLHEGKSALLSSPLLPVSLRAGVESPDVVTMFIDLDKVTTDLKNAEVSSRMKKTHSARKTKKSKTGNAVERAMGNDVLAISLLRNQKQKILSPRWKDDGDDGDDGGGGDHGGGDHGGDGDGDHGGDDDGGDNGGDNDGSDDDGFGDDGDDDFGFGDHSAGDDIGADDSVGDDNSFGDIGGDNDDNSTAVMYDPQADEITKVVQVFLHRGNGVSVSIQDNASNHSV